MLVVLIAVLVELVRFQISCIEQKLLVSQPAKIERSYMLVFYECLSFALAISVLNSVEALLPEHHSYLLSNAVILIIGMSILTFIHYLIDKITNDSLP